MGNDTKEQIENQFNIVNKELIEFKYEIIELKNKAITAIENLNIEVNSDKIMQNLCEIINTLQEYEQKYETLKTQKMELIEKMNNLS